MTQTVRPIGNNHLICLYWMACVTNVEKSAYFVKIVKRIAYGVSSENKIA